MSTLERETDDRNRTQDSGSNTFLAVCPSIQQNRKNEFSQPFKFFSARPLNGGRRNFPHADDLLDLVLIYRPSRSAHWIEYLSFFVHRYPVSHLGSAS